MKLSKVSRGSVAALIAVMLVGAGVLWALADRPASAENTPTSASDELRNVTQSQTIQVEGQSFEIPMLDEYYGSVVIGGIEYPLNQAGQSYGSAYIANQAFDEDYFIHAEEGYVYPNPELTLNDLVGYLPDLVFIGVEGKNPPEDDLYGYLTKEDYVDAFVWSPDEQFSEWPEHQDGVDDYKYYTIYGPDGITEIGTYKRIAVNITESCVLSDGVVVLVGQRGSYKFADGLSDCTDEELERIARYSGEDVEVLIAERDRLLDK